MVYSAVEDRIEVLRALKHIYGDNTALRPLDRDQKVMLDLTSPSCPFPANWDSRVQEVFLCAWRIQKQYSSALEFS